jgi:hypothetical protein
MTTPRRIARLGPARAPSNAFMARGTRRTKAARPTAGPRLSNHDLHRAPDALTDGPWSASPGKADFSLFLYYLSTELFE